MSKPITGRHDRLLIVAGVVLVLSAVAAGFVIFAGDGGTTTGGTALRPQTRTQGGSLVLGRADARHTLDVTEDFGSPRCRAFDVATRDFLRADAAKGLVRVVYRPVQRLSDGYSSEAWDRWTTAAAHGSGGSAAALHSKLYDDQPSPDPATTDSSLPEIALDGHRLPAGDVQQSADRLERALARG